MQKEGKLNSDCKVKLSFEELELLLFRAQKKSIIIQSNFAESRGCSNFLGGERENFEFLKEVRGTTGMAVKR